jgi:hypothetical protein
LLSLLNANPTRCARRMLINSLVLGMGRSR